MAQMIGWHLPLLASLKAIQIWRRRVIGRTDS
jgi:hypothetical protein